MEISTLKKYKVGGDAMAYCFELVTRKGEYVKRIGCGQTVDEALEDILEDCLLSEPGIFFELNEQNFSAPAPEGLKLLVVRSYGVYVKNVEVE